MSTDLRQDHAWVMFLGGRWQKTIPAREGEHWSLDSDGDLIARVVTWNAALGRWLAPAWRAVQWWWSEPTPELPKPPPWGEAETKP